MTPELIAIVAAAVTLAGFIHTVYRDLSDRIARRQTGDDEILEELSELRARMARVEAAMEGFTSRGAAPRRPGGGPEEMRRSGVTRPLIHLARRRPGIRETTSNEGEEEDGRDVT